MGTTIFSYLKAKFLYELTLCESQPGYYHSYLLLNCTKLKILSHKSFYNQNFFNWTRIEKIYHIKGFIYSLNCIKGFSIDNQKLFEMRYKDGFYILLVVLILIHKMCNILIICYHNNIVISQ